MDNQQLLHILQRKIEVGEISKDQVLQLIKDAKKGGTQNTNLDESHSSPITKLFYIIGAAIAIIGISFFVGQIWEEIGTAGRIAVTLGLGILFAGLGSLLLKQKKSLGAVFYILGGALIPDGAMVTLTEFATEDVSIWPVTFTFLLIFIFYLLLTIYHKHVVMTFFAILNGTAVIYLFFSGLLENAHYTITETLYVYITIIVGIVYILLARSFRYDWNHSLYGLLCFFGINAILGPAFAKIFESGIWQTVFVGFIAVALYLSIVMKSKPILTMSTLFLIGYISYISGEYFADSLGWPFLLVILGFLFIGLGYGSIRINKRFIKSD